MDSETRPDPPQPLFRSEALEHYLREADGRGVLQVSPPWTWLLLGGFGAMVVVAMLLSVLGRVEVNDRGRGILRPVEGVRLIMAPTGGIVAERRFNPGDFVPKDSAIIRLNSPQVQANFLEADHRLKLLTGDFSKVASEQDALYLRQKRDLELKVASNKQDLDSWLLSEQIHTHKLKANRDLELQGIAGKLEVETAEENLEQARRQVRAARQALLATHQEMASLEAQRKNQVFTRKSDMETAQVRVDALGYSVRETSLASPVAGYLDALMVRPGDLVQPGQLLAKVMPVGGALQIVSFLPEKNRAYVHPGNLVKLELNQYPAAEFGTLTGRVVRVGTDLISSTEWKEAMGDEAKPDEASFRVEIDLLPQGSGPLQQVQFRPGMLLNVRYTLRKQSLITFAIAPLRRWLN